MALLGHHVGRLKRPLSTLTQQCVWQRDLSISYSGIGEPAGRTKQCSHSLHRKATLIGAATVKVRLNGVAVVAAASTPNAAGP